MVIKYKTSDVFVAGGMPKLTYINRTEKKLETKIYAASENLCKLITVTGNTKSGKTVLVNKVYPRETNIWIDGGGVRTDDDLWTGILEALDGFSGSTVSRLEEHGSSIQGALQAGLPFVKADTGAEINESKQETHQNSRTVTPLVAALSVLRKSRKALIIDDFHYLPREMQGGVVRALKPLIFEGVPVILIAIPHRRYDAIKIEREMTSRLEVVDVPTWDLNELVLIPGNGFKLLDVTVREGLGLQMANEAYGSPHLMQDFCRNLALSSGITESSMPEDQATIDRIDPVLFTRVAEGAGKVIFDKLAKGPRQRGDRNQRRLKNGKTADIYGVTLYALAKIGPGLTTVNYYQIRSALKEILISEDIPQAHEVSRVLKIMAEIAVSDESSIPVLDWDEEERRLHITDPFFAFYLKWGILKGDYEH